MRGPPCPDHELITSDIYSDLTLCPVAGPPLVAGRVSQVSGSKCTAALGVEVKESKYIEIEHFVAIAAQSDRTGFIYATSNSFS